METPMQELISYYLKQEKKGVKECCIHDLLAYLYMKKDKEKILIEEAYSEGQLNGHDKFWNGDYYNDTFKK
tara:strand:+ start:757 stop:969 length:213 start_codon:yes stop_codon:yes gene_type:complete